MIGRRAAQWIFLVLLLTTGSGVPRSALGQENDFAMEFRNARIDDILREDRRRRGEA